VLSPNIKTVRIKISESTRILPSYVLESSSSVQFILKLDSSHYPTKYKIGSGTAGSYLYMAFVTSNLPIEELVWSKDMAILSNLEAKALSSMMSPQSEFKSA
jgi:hypothetical protein